MATLIYCFVLQKWFSVLPKLSWPNFTNFILKMKTHVCLTVWRIWTGRIHLDWCNRLEPKRQWFAFLKKCPNKRCTVLPFPCIVKKSSNILVKNKLPYDAALIRLSCRKQAASLIHETVAWLVNSRRPLFRCCSVKNGLSQFLENCHWAHLNNRFTRKPTIINQVFN